MQQVPNTGPDRAAQLADMLREKSMPEVSVEAGITRPVILYYLKRYGYDYKAIAEQRAVARRIAAEKGESQYDLCDECKGVITRPAPPGYVGPRWCTRMKECRNARQRYLYAYNDNIREAELKRSKDHYDIVRKTRRSTSKRGNVTSGNTNTRQRSDGSKTPGRPRIGKGV